jgi:hypothetical protein
MNGGNAWIYACVPPGMAFFDIAVDGDLCGGGR